MSQAAVAHWKTLQRDLPVIFVFIWDWIERNNQLRLRL